MGIHILVQGVGRVQGRISSMPHSNASGKMKLPFTHGHRQYRDWECSRVFDFITHQCFRAVIADYRIDRWCHFL